MRNSNVDTTSARTPGQHNLCNFMVYPYIMDNNCAKTLTENQKRKSISGSKSDRGSSRGVRNVLAKSYRDHWPVVDNESVVVLTTLLERLLPSACKPLSDDGANALRKLKGKKHVEERHSLQQRMWQENPRAKEMRSSLSLGVNNVSRSLEAGELSSLIIAHEADPPILTRHLGTLAAAQHVPFLVLPGLKGCVKNALKFACLAVGLKKDVLEEEHDFHEIHRLIIDISRKIAEKVTSRNFRRDDSQITGSLPHQEFYVNPQVKTKSPSELYLKRTSKQYRAFVPGKGRVTEPDSSWPQFLSLSINSTPDISSKIPVIAKTPLGMDDIPRQPSFLEKVQKAKLTAHLKDEPIPVSLSNFVSLDSVVQSTTKIETTNVEIDNGCEKEEKPKEKRPRRYFDSELVPLKVKRLQANPTKTKKRRKKRT